MVRRVQMQTCNITTFKKSKHKTLASQTTEKILTELHQQPRSELSKSDDWETPDELYQKLIIVSGVLPQLDVCATKKNKKCLYYLGESDNALHANTEWQRGREPEVTGVWCNPPHSQTGAFVKKAFDQWQKHNINVLMIMPTNTMSSNYWHNYIEGNAEYFAIKGRIRFKIGGVSSQHVSRNAYVCVIFRRR